MKINYKTFFLLLLVTFSISTSFCTTLPISSKKKILAFTSKGGNGHISCTNRLKELFGQQYDIKIINPLETILRSIDTIHWITRKKIDGETLYNRMIQNGWTRSINFFCGNLAPSLFKQRRKKIKRKFLQAFKKENPDLIISTIPFINYPASQAAKDCNIPYMLIGLDLDLTTWLLDLKKAGPDYFPITIPVATDLMYRQLSRQLIPHNKIHVVGPCLRQNFLEKKNVDAIKKEWNLPKNKKTVMVMMGGTGSSQMRKICKRLFKMDKRLHVLACVGRDKQMAQKIKNLTCNDSVSCTTIPFTKKIADLMAVSDVLITKPGPNTCNEAMHMNLPVIIDKSTTPLFWEQATINYVRDNCYGQEMNRLKDLDALLNSSLNRRKTLQKKLNPLKNFDAEITKIVKHLLADDIS